MKLRLLTYAIATAAALGLASCAQDINTSAPIEQQSIEGTWDYQSTDNADLSEYGITYTFTGDTWKYLIPNEGEKDYSYKTRGPVIEATLTEDSFQSGDSLGSRLEASYTIVGDQLTMEYGGHTAILKRHTD
jgi:hypothetical protein